MSSYTKGELVYVPAGVTLVQADPEYSGVTLKYATTPSPRYLLSVGWSEERENHVTVIYENEKWLARSSDVY